MKTFLNLCVCTTLGLLLSCLLSLAAEQPKPSQPGAKPNRPTDADTDPWHRRLAEFHADGLPLSEVANLLSEQFPEVNFVLDPLVREKTVVLKLRSVMLEDIFTAIGITTQSESGGSGLIDPSTGVPIPFKGAIEAKKLSDRMVSFTQRQTPAPEITKPICRAFSLARYLAGKSETEADKALVDVEKVLETCWMLLRDADPSNSKIKAPQLSLHPATKLLLVVGQPDQIEVVQQVIGELEGARGVAGEVFIDPNTGVPAAFGGGAPGFSPDALRAFAARYGFADRYGLRPGQTPSPSSASTNPPVESK